MHVNQKSIQEESSQDHCASIQEAYITQSKNRERLKFSHRVK